MCGGPDQLCTVAARPYQRHVTAGKLILFLSIKSSSKEHFLCGIPKTVFAFLVIHQAFGQNNNIVKGYGGAVGSTENPAAPRHWMLILPKAEGMIYDFEAA